MAAFQTGGSEAGTSRERDANAINQSSKSTREGSIVEIGNVPIFVGSESWLFEKGLASRRRRNDRCDKCNYLRSIKSDAAAAAASSGYEPIG